MYEYQALLRGDGKDQGDLLIQRMNCEGEKREKGDRQRRVRS